MLNVAVSYDTLRTLDEVMMMMNEKRKTHVIKILIDLYEEKSLFREKVNECLAGEKVKLTTDKTTVNVLKQDKFRLYYISRLKHEPVYKLIHCLAKSYLEAQRERNLAL